MYKFLEINVTRNQQNGIM